MIPPENHADGLQNLPAFRAAPDKSVWMGVASSGLTHLGAVVVIWGATASGLFSYAPPPGQSSQASTASIALDAAYAAQPEPKSTEAQLTVSTISPESTAAPPLAAEALALERATPQETALPLPLPSEVSLPQATIATIPPPTSRRQEWSADPPSPRDIPAEATTSRQISQNPLAAPQAVVASAVSPASDASAARSGVRADLAPAAEHAPDPKYPPDLLAAGVEGVVTLQLTIAANGGVERAVVAVSSGYPALDRSALDAVAQWKFRPATSLGLPVSITVLKRVRFVITR
jgi:protein TonB